MKILTVENNGITYYIVVTNRYKILGIFDCIDKARVYIDELNEFWGNARSSFVKDSEVKVREEKDMEVTEPDALAEWVDFTYNNLGESLNNSPANSLSIL